MRRRIHGLPKIVELQSRWQSNSWVTGTRISPKPEPTSLVGPCWFRCITTITTPCNTAVKIQKNYQATSIFKNRRGHDVACEFSDLLQNRKVWWSFLASGKNSSTWSNFHKNWHTQFNICPQFWEVSLIATFAKVQQGTVAQFSETLDQPVRKPLR